MGDFGILHKLDGSITAIIRDGQDSRAGEYLAMAAMIPWCLIVVPCWFVFGVIKRGFKGIFLAD